MNALSRNPASRCRTLLRLRSARRSRGTLTSFVLLVVLLAIACTQRGLLERPKEKRGITGETVHFDSDGIRLAGTLVLPAGSQAHPAAVLFHGPGPQKKDLFSAPWIHSVMIGALAYDKRGVG